MGAYYDYSPEWYANIGNLIVDTMLIYAFWPYFALFLMAARPWIRKKIDTRFTNDPYVTKQTQMLNY